MTLVDCDRSDGEIVSGYLCDGNRTRYPIERSVPRFVGSGDPDQAQTRDAFAYKWQKRDTYDSPQVMATYASWLTEKYGFESTDAMAEYYASSGRVLDLGCGSGFSSSTWLGSSAWQNAEWVGVDISVAVDVAQDRLARIPGTHFVQADGLLLPFADDTFSTVFSEGVLHHTPSTRKAIDAGARVLAPGGEFHFYVYKKKSPIREYTDDFVREKLSGLSNEAVWDEMRSLTELGRALSELDAKITLSRDVSTLEIPAGEHDVQRLLYWHFAKLFWNPTWTFEENVHVNFDWYRPSYAHRQTENQVRTWCDEAGTDIVWFHEQESGFTVRAKKRD